MTLGVPGTGPYSKLRTLHQQIRDDLYEISLIDRGIKTGSKADYQKRIAEARAEIKQIKAQIKKGKAR